MAWTNVRVCDKTGSQVTRGAAIRTCLQMRACLAQSCLWGIVMKPLITALCVVSAFGSLSAQKPVWQPSPGHTQVPIWPGRVPDPQPVAGPEAAATSGKGFLVAGRPAVGVSNVTQPTMTVYSPKGKNTGAAVVVFPGGGYQVLAIDLEGTEVCDWLTPKGITCVLLKYRVTDVGPYPKSGPYPESAMALEDAQRTVGLVRFHAAEWHIDPHKIGVLGFSAGGHLSAAMSTHFPKRLYLAVDAADKESCRPDFALAIYPGHLSLSAAEWDAKQGTKKFVIPHPATADKDLALNPEIPVTSQTPPTFLLQAEDDHVDNVNDSLAYYIALKKAGVPVEMHLYAQGGHAFGLRRTKFPITRWPQLVETWLGTIGMISE
jgi:acetyl esterase/lipase